MCDQTEVEYSPGEVVWYKLSTVWWPAQVQNISDLDETITQGLKKKPLAVVKFFNEDYYDFVKNIDQIYHYNCKKKFEFIRKGMDCYRSLGDTNQMSKFPKDVILAEELTSGDINILNDPRLAPEEKVNYKEYFTPPKKVDGKVSKKLKNSLSKSKLSVGNSSSPSFVRYSPSGSKKMYFSKDLIQKETQQVTNEYRCETCSFVCSRLTAYYNHKIFNKQNSCVNSHSYSRTNSSSSKLEKSPLKRKSIGSEGPTVKRKPKLSKKGLTPVSSKKVIRVRTSKPKDPQDKKKFEEMREQLLQDWNEDEDEDSMRIDEGETSFLQDSDDDKSSEKPVVNKSNIDKTSCFDFEENDEAINLDENMKFGQKLPRVISTDKSKSKDDSTGPKFKNKDPTQDEDSLELEFNNIMNETSVPVVPIMTGSFLLDSSALPADAGKAEEQPTILGNKTVDDHRVSMDPCVVDDVKVLSEHRIQEEITQIMDSPHKTYSEIEIQTTLEEDNALLLATLQSDSPSEEETPNPGKHEPVKRSNSSSVVEVLWKKMRCNVEPNSCIPESTHTYSDILAENNNSVMTEKEVDISFQNSSNLAEISEKLSVEKLYDKPSDKIIPDDKSCVEKLPEDEHSFEKLLDDKLSFEKNSNDTPSIKDLHNNKSSFEKIPDNKSSVDELLDSELSVKKLPDNEPSADVLLDSELSVKKFLNSKPSVKKLPENKPSVDEFLDNELSVKKLPDPKPLVERFPDNKPSINEFLDSELSVEMLLDSKPLIQDHPDFEPIVEKLSHDKSSVGILLDDKPSVEGPQDDKSSVDEESEKLKEKFGNKILSTNNLETDSNMSMKDQSNDKKWPRNNRTSRRLSSTKSYPGHDQALGGSVSSKDDCEKEKNIDKESVHGQSDSDQLNSNKVMGTHCSDLSGGICIAESRKYLLRREKKSHAKYSHKKKGGKDSMQNRVIDTDDKITTDLNSDEGKINLLVKMQKEGSHVANVNSSSPNKSPNDLKDGEKTSNKHSSCTKGRKHSDSKSPKKHIKDNSFDSNDGTVAKTPKKKTPGDAAYRKTLSKHSSELSSVESGKRQSREVRGLLDAESSKKSSHNDNSSGSLTPRKLSSRSINESFESVSPKKSSSHHSDKLSVLSPKKASLQLTESESFEKHSVESSSCVKSSTRKHSNTRRSRKSLNTKLQKKDSSLPLGEALSKSSMTHSSKSSGGDSHSIQDRGEKDRKREGKARDDSTHTKKKSSKHQHKGSKYSTRSSISSDSHENKHDSEHLKSKETDKSIKSSSWLDEKMSSSERKLVKVQSSKSHKERSSGHSDKKKEKKVDKMMDTFVEELLSKTTKVEEIILRDVSNASEIKEQTCLIDTGVESTSITTNLIIESQTDLSTQIDLSSKKDDTLRDEESLNLPGATVMYENTSYSVDAIAKEMEEIFNKKGTEAGESEIPIEIKPSKSNDIEVIPISDGVECNIVEPLESINLNMDQSITTVEGTENKFGVADCLNESDNVSEFTVVTLNSCVNIYEKPVTTGPNETMLSSIGAVDVSDNSLVKSKGNTLLPETVNIEEKSCLNDEDDGYVTTYGETVVNVCETAVSPLKNKSVCVNSFELTTEEQSIGAGITSLLNEGNQTEGSPLKSESTDINSKFDSLKSPDSKIIGISKEADTSSSIFSKEVINVPKFDTINTEANTTESGFSISSEKCTMSFDTTPVAVSLMKNSLVDTSEKSSFQSVFDHSNANSNKPENISELVNPTVNAIDKSDSVLPTASEYNSQDNDLEAVASDSNCDLKLDFVSEVIISSEPDEHLEGKPCVKTSDILDKKYETPVVNEAYGLNKTRLVGKTFTFSEGKICLKKAVNTSPGVVGSNFEAQDEFAVTKVVPSDFLTAEKIKEIYKREEEILMKSNENKEKDTKELSKFPSDKSLKKGITLPIHVPSIDIPQQISPSIQPIVVPPQAFLEDKSNSQVSRARIHCNATDPFDQPTVPASFVTVTSTPTTSCVTGRAAENTPQEFTSTQVQNMNFDISSMPVVIDYSADIAASVSQTATLSSHPLVIASAPTTATAGPSSSLLQPIPIVLTTPTSPQPSKPKKKNTNIKTIEIELLKPGLVKPNISGATLISIPARPRPTNKITLGLTKVKSILTPHILQRKCVTGTISQISKSDATHGTKILILPKQGNKRYFIKSDGKGGSQIVNPGTVFTRKSLTLSNSSQIKSLKDIVITVPNSEARTSGESKVFVDSSLEAGTANKRKIHSLTGKGQKIYLTSNKNKAIHGSQLRSFLPKVQSSNLIYTNQKLISICKQPDSMENTPKKVVRFKEPEIIKSGRNANILCSRKRTGQIKQVVNRVSSVIAETIKEQPSPSTNPVSDNSSLFINFDSTDVSVENQPSTSIRAGKEKLLCLESDLRDESAETVAKPHQDILAKALADTQVLQSETEAVSLGQHIISSYIEQPLGNRSVCAAPILLSQPPIMSASEGVSYCSVAHQETQPSMPLLSDDSELQQSQISAPVFTFDCSEFVIPSGSKVSTTNSALLSSTDNISNDCLVTGQSGSFSQRSNDGIDSQLLPNAEALAPESTHPITDCEIGNKQLDADINLSEIELPPGCPPDSSDSGASVPDISAIPLPPEPYTGNKSLSPSKETLCQTEQMNSLQSQLTIDSLSMPEFQSSLSDEISRTFQFSKDSDNMHLSSTLFQGVGKS